MDRREMMTGTATASITPAPAFARHDGLTIADKFYNVSPDFMREVLKPHPDLCAMSVGEMELRSKVLFDLADDRFHFRKPANTWSHVKHRYLTPTEGDRLEALFRVMNCHTAINGLGDKTPAEFGLQYADQVHLQRENRSCGCEVLYVKDHFTCFDKGPVKLMQLRRLSCEQHRLDA